MITPTIKLLIGYSGSGKSTWAQNFINNTDEGKSYLSVSRDKVRELLYSYDESNVNLYYKDKEFSSKENTMISPSVEENVQSILDKGKNVIVDNTNLDKKYIDKFRKRFYWCNFELIFIPILNQVTTKEAILRDKNRLRSVGKSVIKIQVQKYNNLISQYQGKYTITKDATISLYPYHKIEELNNDASKPSCIIFDVDGTLAQNNGRSPFDWNRVNEDLPRENIIKLAKFHKENGIDIIVCTGRSEEASKLTKEWLDKYGVQYDKFYIRKSKDFRPDWLVKEEMWRDIVKDNYVIACYDDRDQVVRHGRFLGLDMLQVNYGNF